MAHAQRVYIQSDAGAGLANSQAYLASNRGNYGKKQVYQDRLQETPCPPGT